MCNWILTVASSSRSLRVDPDLDPAPLHARFGTSRGSLRRETMFANTPDRDSPGCFIFRTAMTGIDRRNGRRTGHRPCSMPGKAVHNDVLVRSGAERYVSHDREAPSDWTGENRWERPPRDR